MAIVDLDWNEWRARQDDAQLPIVCLRPDAQDYAKAAFVAGKSIGRRRGAEATTPSPRLVPDRCPSCNSPRPHLHPAVQSGGEVHVCPDAFHARQTPENARWLAAAPAAPAEGDALSDEVIGQLAWRAGFDMRKEDDDNESTEDWRWPDCDGCGGAEGFDQLRKFANLIRSAPSVMEAVARTLGDGSVNRAWLFQAIYILRERAALATFAEGD